jgi:hypothetical protein
VFLNDLLLVDRCERDGGILGAGGRMEVFKPTTKNRSSPFILFLLYSFKHPKLIGVVTICLSLFFLA